MNDARTGTGFDNEVGLQSLKLLQRLTAETHMTVATDVKPYRQQFFAGKLGFFVASPSAAANFAQTVGNRFTMRTAPFPIGAANGTLPTGGNVVTITAQDPAHQKAAWDYVKFVTSAQSQADVAKATGYMPTNKQSGEALQAFYASNPIYATAFAQVPLSAPWYGYPGGKGAEIWRAQRKIIDQVQRGALSPDEGLKEMISTTNSLLN
ncbi:multiple sugar transport system substrate-binding protein [Rhizobium tibeticum]|uniref:Glycerol-3-phosphate transporter periplasmic binding protein n=1 Tax=Rhizobium tibeticum TaxID=501024 RepID=A0A1H8WQN2_9HYPH|nr:glycerol-3-phosphate transporter periplasmic binding protein [Rhizobium tibeticum]SEP29942.1 multiple sugar transport system substrate-binding protein [Rhizobium tibeticum]